MAKFLFPSSFECDCKKQLNFFESTISEMKTMSERKKVSLAEGDHIIIFYKGEPIEIICPKLNSCQITSSE